MKPDKITVHCTVTPNGQAVSMKTIDRAHRARGFKKFGYHLLIHANGRAEIGRRQSEQGAHVKGHNEGNLGICLVGTDKFSKLQLAALQVMIGIFSEEHDIPLYEVYCHYQFDTANGKTCPNIKINHLLHFIMTNKWDAINQYVLEE